MGQGTIPQDGFTLVGARWLHQVMLSLGTGIDIPGQKKVFKSYLDGEKKWMCMIYLEVHYDTMTPP